MRTRKIAVVGLTDDAAHALHSMLKIVDGRSGAAWLLSTPDEADVLMAGEISVDAVVDRWARTTKPMIAIHEGRLSRPMTPYTLRHPFRVMQLLTVLGDVESAMEATPTETVRCPQAGAAVTPWSFAESLRLLSRCTHRGQWYAAGSGENSVLLREDLGTYYIAPAALERLRTTGLFLPPLEPTAASIPASHIARPLFELAWFAGLHGPSGLAPWLEAQSRFHLRRWPDFGLVGARREHLVLSAALARSSLGRGRMTDLAHQPIDGVDRFLNACSMAGLLVNATDTSVPAPVAAPLFNAVARFGDLFRGLRMRLGLAG